jgi:uncharacterized protein
MRFDFSGRAFSRSLTRRELLARVSGAVAAASVCGTSLPLSHADPFPEIAEGQIWDLHGHLSGAGRTPEESIDRSLKVADRMGIRRVVVSMGMSFSYDPSPEDFRRQNDDVLRAVRHAPDRVFGFVYLNPKHGPESLKELDRCVVDGPMVGVKLWVAVHCNDPRLDPIISRAAELKAPIYQHTYWRTAELLPGESNPADLAELARRHPDARLICGHTGNDWERGIRAIRAAKNVSIDLSGCDPTAGMVEMAVRELGPERVMYGSDFPGRSFASQLAKVYSADLPEAARRLILAGNLRGSLLPILNAKGIRT